MTGGDEANHFRILELWKESDMLNMLLKESITGRFGLKVDEFEEHRMESIVLRGKESRIKPPHTCYRPTWAGVVWFEVEMCFDMCT